MVDHIVIDIETCPLDMEKYNAISDDDEKLKLLNPIDSKVVALGIHADGKSVTFIGKDEKKILEDFWSELKTIKKGNPMIPIVGFSILNFDLPFLVSRSFINNVVITPFTQKEIIDLRDKINAYRYGNTRGKLKEYGALMGIKLHEKEGSDVADLCANDDFGTLKTYLEKDLEITEEMYKRTVELNIIKITKW